MGPGFPDSPKSTDLFPAGPGGPLGPGGPGGPLGPLIPIPEIIIYNSSLLLSNYLLQRYLPQVLRVLEGLALLELQIFLRFQCLRVFQDFLEVRRLPAVQRVRLFLFLLEDH